MCQIAMSGNEPSALMYVDANVYKYNKNQIKSVLIAVSEGDITELSVRRKLLNKTAEILLKIDDNAVVELFNEVKNIDSKFYKICPNLYNLKVKAALLENASNIKPGPAKPKLI